MIADLLKRWSELEPDRCRCYEGDLMMPSMYDVWFFDGLEECWVTIGSFNRPRMSLSGLAILQYALQQAVVAHNFWLRLENSEGWEAVVSTTDEDRGFFPYEQGEEPAIVILKSYMARLESERSQAQ